MTQSDAMTPPDAATVRYLADRLAIADVMTQYFSAMDKLDFPTVRACFTDDIDAIYSGRRVAGGIEALMSFFDGTSELRLSAVDLEVSTHFMGNHLATIGSDGSTATAETYALAHLVDRPSTGRRMRTRGLRYLDELVREPDGTWRISRRHHLVDWMKAEQPLDI
jgi:ketosteroid isomerase-like protein